LHFLWFCLLWTILYLQVLAVIVVPLFWWASHPRRARG
jgi:hypothetical protein